MGKAMKRPTPTAAHVSKIKGIQVGPVTPKPGSMLKQPKAPKTR